MSEMQDYKSSLTDTSSRKFETFSYLPAMTTDGIKKQVEYLVRQGLNPAIEHTEPENARDNYWYMWKLPMFGETNVDKILAEAEARIFAIGEEVVGVFEAAVAEIADMFIEQGLGNGGAEVAVSLGEGADGGRFALPQPVAELPRGQQIRIEVPSYELPNEPRNIAVTLVSAEVCPKA